MDPNALGFVGQSVTVTTVLGVLTGSAISFVRRLPGTGIAMGANCGISGALFFGSREFVVSPLLVKNLDTPQYARRRESLVPNDVSMALDTRGVRTNRLLDSCISGAFTGCILHSIMRGRTRILAGVLTGGLISASLQYAANELNLVRIRYVSSRMADTSLPAPTNDDGSRIKPASESLSSVSPRNPEMHNLEDSAHSTKPYAFSERILDAMSYVLPMRKLAPEEYTALMEKKRLEGTHETQEQKSPRENSNGGHL